MGFINILIVFILVRHVYLLERKWHQKYQYEAICNNVTRDPYFDEDKVIGKTWRIYYAWNLMLEHNCMDISFKKVTYAIIERYRATSEKYLETKPNWSNATLLMTKNFTREMLLIPDSDPQRAGRYVGVPFIFNDSYKGARLGQVPLFKMGLKLFTGGRYLIISDCQYGVVSLLVRRDQKHTRREIQTIISTFDFSLDGFPACKYYYQKKRRRGPH